MCNIVGPVDFTDPYYADHEMIADLVNYLIDPASIPEGVDALEYLSPVIHAGLGKTPTISFFGTTDELVPLSQKEQLEAALDEHNVLHHSYSYAGDHGGLAIPENYEMFLEKMQLFFDALEIETDY